MLKYKLTTKYSTTYRNTQWGKNITHETTGFGELCGAGWLHYYHHPTLAVLLNSIHADIYNPILWECEAEGDHLDDHGLKGGCTKLTTLRIIPLPKIIISQQIEIAIKYIQSIIPTNTIPAWDEWIKAWPDNRISYICKTISAYKICITKQYYHNQSNEHLHNHYLLCSAANYIIHATEFAINNKILNLNDNLHINFTIANAISSAAQADLTNSLVKSVGQYEKAQV